MITREAILHIPKSNYAYAYDKETLHIRVRTKKGEIKKAYLRIGDPYEWAVGGLAGGDLSGKDAMGWIGAHNYLMIKEAETEYFDYWFLAYKPEKKRARYAFILENDSEKILFGEKNIEVLNNDESDETKLSYLPNFFAFPYLNGKDVLDAPKWAKNTIWYQIFPERFCNGNPSISPENVEEWGSIPLSNNFMGGDLYGIYDKLDYLEELGITGIYLCPIFYGKTNHKYDTIDYYRIDPHFGDDEIFKKLVDKAHSKGIKIMLDAVFNHVGSEFPYWKDVVEKGENSKYADWFVIKKFPVYEDKPLEEWDFKNLNYETFADVHIMPKLNVENSECRRYLLDVAKYWIEKFDIDGWRLDVCNEIDHKFWREFREELKKVKKDLYIVGEIWHDSLPWLRGDQFDAVMNYPISEAILDFIAFNETSGLEFKYAVNKTLLSYPINVNEVNFNLLDSHDTTRVMSFLNEDIDKFKLVFALMFFQTGGQCIYYGTEIGLSGRKGMGSELNRKCMDWSEENAEKETYKFMQQLIKIRKENPDFQINNIEWLKADNDKIIIMKKGDITLVINNSDLDYDFNFNNFIPSNNCIDLFSNTIINNDVKLLPYTFLLLKNN